MQLKIVLVLAIILSNFNSSQAVTIVKGAQFYQDAKFFCPKAVTTKTHSERARAIAFDVIMTVVGMSMPDLGFGKGALKALTRVSTKTLEGYVSGAIDQTFEKSTKEKFTGHPVKKCEVTFHTSQGKIKRTMRGGTSKMLKFAKYGESKNRFPHKIQIKIDVKGAADLHFSAEAPNLNSPKARYTSKLGSKKNWFHYAIHDNGKGGLSWQDAQYNVNTLITYLRTPYVVKKVKLSCPDRGKLRNCRVEYYNKHGKLQKTNVSKNRSKTIDVYPQHGFKLIVDLKNRSDINFTWRDAEGLHRHGQRWGGCKDGYGKSKHKQWGTKCLSGRRYMQITGQFSPTRYIRGEILPGTKLLIAVEAIQGKNKTAKQYDVAQSEIDDWKARLLAGGIRMLG